MVASLVFPCLSLPFLLSCCPVRLASLQEESLCAAHYTVQGTFPAEGVCPVCGHHFEYDEMEGDHIVPWSKGGKTVPENLQMLCRRDNALKSDR